MTTPPKDGFNLRTASVLTAVILIAAFGCRGDLPEDDLPIEVQVETAPTPPIVGPSRLVVSVTDSAGAPVSDASIEVEGTMSHAGMAPVRERAEPADLGRYIVPEFEFTMGGDWILRLEITLADGRQGVRTRELRVISGGPPTEDGA